MVKSCRKYFEKPWFKYAMRIIVFFMNYSAWYLINYELIEYWHNPMDKYVVKFTISILAVFMAASFVTAFARGLTKIPEQTDP